jgi:hypothetical protein
VDLRHAARAILDREREAGMRRSLGLLITVMAPAFSGCGGGADAPAAPACVDASGTWDMGDMGSDGRWTIVQAACSVTLTSSLGLFGSVAQGAAGPAGLSARWTLTEQPCRTSYQLDAAVSGTNLRGTLHWVSYSYGNGNCPSVGFLTRDVSGKRL